MAGQAVNEPGNSKNLIHTAVRSMGGLGSRVVPHQSRWRPDQGQRPANPDSSDGGMDPRWRRDGRELYFVACDFRLMAADVKTDGDFSSGVPIPLFRFSGNVETTRRSYWPSPDGQRFLVIKGSNDLAAQIQVTISWAEALNK